MGSGKERLAERGGGNALYGRGKAEECSFGYIRKDGDKHGGTKFTGSGVGELSTTQSATKGVCYHVPRDMYA